MKTYFAIFATLISVAFASNEIKRDFSEVKVQFDKEFAQGFLAELEKARAGDISANVDEYADKIFENMKSLIIHVGMDPMQLPDLDQSFLTAKITLTEGWLQGVASMHRNGDVIVDYSSDTNTVKLSVPMGFEDILFSYNYHMIILFIGPSGGVNGKVTNFNLKFELGFDFNSYEAILTTFKVTDSGHIDVTFTGNALIDWAANILSEFTTTILKPLICGIIEGIVRGALDAVIKVINEVINAILHPPIDTTTDVPPITVPAFIYRK